MAASAGKLNLVDVVAAEMAFGVERAVDCWMAQVESVLTDTRLTTLGRLSAVRNIVEQYKCLTGKRTLEGRYDLWPEDLP